jgi:hypothetical protein
MNPKIVSLMLLVVIVVAFPISLTSIIINTEEIVDNELIRSEPWETKIPFFVVDAVVEVPYGSHPCHGRADSCTNKGGFADGCVDNPLVSKLIPEKFSCPKDADLHIFA